jgi:hypothetical protein
MQDTVSRPHRTKNFGPEFSERDRITLPGGSKALRHVQDCWPGIMNHGTSQQRPSVAAATQVLPITSVLLHVSLGT